MDRARILCPHGILGVVQCKICQREQHTDRVRELRRQQRELRDQESNLEKSYMKEHYFVDVHSIQQTRKETA